MKKGVLFLVCAMILTMILPAQALELQQSQVQNLPINDDINGKYVISVKSVDGWNEVGFLNFGKHQSTQNIRVVGYLNSGDDIIIKLTQKGGGNAYLDCVMLDQKQAINVNDDEKMLQKLSKQDLDITPVGDEGVILKFSEVQDGLLTVVGRIENEVISKEPIQFPAENNFKSKDEVKDFYTYAIGSTIKTLKIDGVLDEVTEMEPFVKEYRVPDSGHPAGNIYFWVMNDNENLYVTMDTTPDNTYDGEKDYAKIYVKTNYGIKEFKVSVPETTWGKSNFTYTDKVDYEHKVYEFSIPLDELNLPNDSKISIAFVAYGTMSYDYSQSSPALAYDSFNEIYLSVFEQRLIVNNVNYQTIVGQYVDKSGITKGEKFFISNYEIKSVEFSNTELLYPDVAFNQNTNQFLVTWVENHSSSDYLCAKLTSYNNDSDYQPFIVSSDDQDYHSINSTKVSCDPDKSEFLVVWEEIDNNDDSSIFGQFINENGIKINSKSNISTTSSEGKTNPSLAYSNSQEAFLVTWQNGINVVACGINLRENINISNISVIGTGENSDVSYNNSNQRLFLTWENEYNLYGRYYDLNYISGVNYLDPKPIGDTLTLSTPHDNYLVGYPSTYYDGYRNMTCVWSLFKPEQECFAELCYVDIYGEIDGPSFFTDEELVNRDEINCFRLPIAISGDNDIQNLIAYVKEDNNKIGYRIIGDTPEIPSIIACENPDIAYDSYNELYLSVFEYRQSDYDYNPLSSYIYGEIVDRDGYVVSDKFPISKNIEFDFNYTPTLSYDRENKCFLVVWSTQYNEKSILMATTVTLGESNEYIEIGDANFVSGNDIDESNYSEENPDLACDNKGKFLLVWRQYASDNFDIYGRIIDLDNNSQNSNFPVANDSSSQMNPSVCYNPASDAYLVAWNYWNEGIEEIQTQIVSSSGESSRNGTLSIGGIRCNFPNISFNNQNEQFFITWHDYSSNRSVVKGQYISLNSELLPEKQKNEILITPEDYYHGIYPASYGDGNGKMLCSWSSTFFEDNIYDLRLQYVDQNSDHVGEAFYPDEYNEYYINDNLTASSRISMSGDNLGKIIAAYYYEPEQLYLRSSNYNGFHNYKLDIGYRIFGEGEPYIEPYIEFSNAPFDEIIVGDTVQTKVKLYDNENPNGIEINSDLYYFSENSDIATINNTGLITGITEGETSVSAIYDPFAQSDSDDVKFSDGLVTMKNPEKVKVVNKQSPSLEFDKTTYDVNVNNTTTFSVTLKNYNDISTKNVTDIVSYNLGNSKIASITTSGAITGLAVGTTTVSAIYADIDVEPATALIVVKSVESPKNSSSTPARTPIGEILIDNKVTKTLYEEDVKSSKDSYTFIADKSGKSARLWLNSNFYKSLANDNPTKIIKFKWDNGTYTLPLKCNELLKEINSSAKRVNVYIEKVDDKDIIKKANDSANKIGANVISELIDFSVVVEKNKENKEIKSLNFYGERTINKLGKINKDISTAMKFIEEKKAITFAPSIFNEDYATIKYRGNGIFTIVENPQTFNDINSHWAKNNIEKLATRNIALGRENNNYEPNDFITRAEFAVMITRALGITEEEGSNDFTDVSNEWFAEDISTAYEKKLINGKSDGKFYPDEKIQRKDMAVIIQNALEFTGINLEVSDTESVLSMFNDSNSISNYARVGVALCAKAGIIM